MPLFSLTSGGADFLAFVWQREKMEQKKKRDAGGGGGSVAGQTAPAKQRIYCHGKASSPCSV